MVHIPVLQKEVLAYLDPKPNEDFIDCTIGGAGHTLAILEKNGPKGRALGIDVDPEIIKNLEAQISNTRAAAKGEESKLSSYPFAVAREGEEEDLSSSPIEFKKRIILVCDNFANLKEIAAREKFQPVSGILFDLGMSSWHLEESGRGFSFLKDEPLDMRYDESENRCQVKSEKLTAKDLVNNWSEGEIENILREYGEEKFAKKIAKNIVKERKIAPIKTTFQLVKIIKKAVPFRYQHPERQRRGKKKPCFLRPQKLHCATRTFQAIRIAVNGELNNLKKALPQALNILKPGGRIVVISFHSLEDRIVKNFFKECTAETSLKLITKKPVEPSKEEIKINPRSRSAKLRAAEKQLTINPEGQPSAPCGAGN